MIIKFTYPLSSLDVPRSLAEIRMSGTFDGGTVGGTFKTTLP